MVSRLTISLQCQKVRSQIKLKFYNVRKKRLFKQKSLSLTDMFSYKSLVTVFIIELKNSQPFSLMTAVFAL